MYISDPIDSDIRLVEDDGSSSDYKEFDPYGARHEVYAPSDRDKFDPFRYRFGLVDRGGTGRFLFGVRWYDPNQGVWTQQDSLDAPLDPVNANRYGHAGGDPVNNWDPAGLATQVGLNSCYILCLNIGGSIDDIHNANFADLNLGIGIGPRGAAEVYFMSSESDPNGEFSITGNGSCSAALVIGLGFGLSFPPKSGAIGGVAGLGLGCSANLSFNIPLPVS